MMFATKTFRHWVFALLMGFLTACATTEPAVVEEPLVWADATEVIASGYRAISEKYIDPLDVDKLAVDGIKGFASIDPAISVSIEDATLVLSYAGKALYSATLPPDGSIEQWATLTSEMAIEARKASHDLRGSGAEKIYEAVFDGVLSGLDLFSRYAGAEDARRNRARRDGFGGIGIRYKKEQDVFRILSVTPAMPAADAGIQARDQLTHVDGKPVQGLSIRQVSSYIRGPTHTTVTLTVSRDGSDEPMEFKLMREHIVPTTVTEKRLGNVVYLKISSFNHDTAQSLSDKLETAIDSMDGALEGFIIDLRGNPGGLLKQSVKAADLFLTQGNIITTKGRHADSLHVYEAGGRDLTGGLPLILLVDGKSASAAEVVAAALQDRERAVLIGTSSYGKGTVQTVLRLPNEGEITLTWSRMIAPSGYVLHGLGVRPELCIPETVDNIAKLVESALDTAPDVKLTFDQWRVPGLKDSSRREKLRASCPAERHEADTELAVAQHLIKNPDVYAKALSLSTRPAQASK